MTTKFQSKYNLENTNLIKKIFVKNFYEKFLNRKNLVDDNSNIYIIKKDIKHKFGFSTVKNAYIYVHKYNNNFVFDSYLLESGLFSQTNLVYNFYKILLNFQNLNKLSFFFLKPSKGGFQAYCLGIKAYIPVFQSLILLKNIKMNIKKNKIFFCNFLNNKRHKKYFYLIKIHKLILKYFFPSKNGNFSKSKKFKVRRKSFKFLFLINDKKRIIKKHKYTAVKSIKKHRDINNKKYTINLHVQ